MKILLGVGLITVGILIIIFTIRYYFKQSYRSEPTGTNLLFAGIGFIVLGIIAIIQSIIIKN